MATKKIVIFFDKNPNVGDSFRFQVFGNIGVIPFENGQNLLNISFGLVNLMPFQSVILPTLDQTLTNLLQQLNMGWNANFTNVLGQNTQITYEKIDNTIVVNITSVNPVLSRVFNLFGTSGTVRFFTATPCRTAYISNLTSIGAQFIYDLPNDPSGYNILNTQLNQNQLVSIPNGFDCEQLRGFYYILTRPNQNDLLSAWGFYPQLTQENVLFTFNDGTLIVNVTPTLVNTFFNEVPNTFEFSLNGINWQTSNQFDELETGEYTLFVRDQYGCVTNFEVNLSQQPTVEPYHFISESNSIRFAQRVEWGNCGNYKNRFNTLSCEENVEIPYKFTQLFQNCDAITTQVLTSYDNVEVLAGETEIEAQKIVANIGLRDKRDTTYFTLPNGQLACVFTTGNIYLFNSTDVIGTYNLNGALPEWGRIGNFALTPYGNFQITNIQILDSGFRALVFNANVFVLGNVSGTIQSEYNRDTFDIWEFTINMNDFQNTDFRVGVRFYNEPETQLFPDVFYVSEMISVRDRHEKTLQIRWRNSKNTDMYWFSGIESMSRLAFADINTFTPDAEVQNQKTDSRVISIDAINYNQMQLQVDLLTTAMVVKINLALMHDFLVIEDVPYKLAETPTIERKGKSNLYSLEAVLIEAGDVFNQGTANTQVFFSNTELAGFLDSGNNEFIQI